LNGIRFLNCEKLNSEKVRKAAFQGKLGFGVSKLGVKNRALRQKNEDFQEVFVGWTKIERSCVQPNYG